MAVAMALGITYQLVKFRLERCERAVVGSCDTKFATPEQQMSRRRPVIFGHEGTDFRTERHRARIVRVCIVANEPKASQRHRRR